MNPRLVALVLCCLVWVAAPAGAVRANDAAPVSVTGSREDRDSVAIVAEQPGSSGRSSAGSALSSVEPLKERVTVRPSCSVTAAAPGATRFVDNCVPDKCANGQDQYLRIVEDIQKGGSSVSLFCGESKADLGVLAVQEFYRAPVKVSAPAVSPSAATFAHFPNIFWSDVKTYEQPTGITVAKVAIKFIPVKYVWDFGDTETMTTTEPGKPYDPALIDRLEDIEKNYATTHRYRKTGLFGIKLTVTFNGQYSVNGGNWQPIAGSLQSTSPAHDLTVKQARGQFITTE
ncbi:MAG: hypothetical protein ACR2JX_07095 [Mycobacteriales bacterium]